VTPVARLALAGPPRTRRGRALLFYLEAVRGTMAFGAADGGQGARSIVLVDFMAEPPDGTLAHPSPRALLAMCAVLSVLAHHPFVLSRVTCHRGIKGLGGTGH
jgi:hypothetical protein